MSLAIDTDKIELVLLVGEPESFPVKSFSDGRSSFTIDAYEFIDGSTHQLALGGGRCEGVPSCGFSFLRPDGKRISGPLTSILAVIERQD